MTSNKPMRTLIFLTLILINISVMKSQSPQYIEAVPDSIVTVTGDLSEGAIMEDLSWAWNASVACFPETQVDKFTGNHVLYTANLVSYSEMIITVIPDDPNADFSLYAYEIGNSNYDAIVPNLKRCVRCEVDHKWDGTYNGKTQDHRRIVRDILATRNPYKVVIGVVGANGLTEGSYTLQIDFKKL